jgi:XTP/dITP diphosphohydrolase
MNIYLSTENKGKLKEYKAILEPKHSVKTPRDVGVVLTAEETAEDGDTFEENAHIKARVFFNKLRADTNIAAPYAVIADDSGLCIDFLDGAPGIYSARYGGHGLSDTDKCKMILDELSGVPRGLRTARFVCAIYCIIYDGQNEDEREFCVTGELVGEIGDELRGENGFGYDPIFFINEETALAELCETKKNAVSHRYDAIKKFLDEL